MDETNLFNAIEKLYQEKQDLLRKFQVENSILWFFHLLAKGKIKKIFSIIFEKIIFKFHKKSSLLNSPKSNPIFENTFKSRNSQIALYTCIIGEYDKPQLPLVNIPNVDFFIFTDKPEKLISFSSSAHIKKIPTELLKKGNILANRYIKFHPSELFATKYDYSLYIDGNIRVISDIRPFVNQCSQATGLAMHRHRHRQCIYEEADICTCLRKGNHKAIKAQIKKYLQEGFPKNFGMNEANIILSDLKNNQSKLLLNEWWNEFEQSNSLRDQIAWPYILWKSGFSIEDVGFLGYDIQKNNKFEIHNHII